MGTANGFGLLGCEIAMPRTGAWHGDVEAELEADLSALVTLVIDGETFVGTSLPGRSGPNGARMVARIVGGKGGLSTELSAQGYESAAGVRVSAILGDILRATGETLSSTADTATLSRRLPRWHRSAGPASHALVQLADAVGADWRVLADGSVWIGPATWPEQTVEHVLEDEDWARGCLYIAPEKPDLRPGVTFLGQQIETVTHRVNRDGFLRTEAHITSLRSAFARMMGRIRRDVDYSRMYRCRVATQHADGTLQLVPDDDKMKGRGLDKVRIRLGLPGFRVEVPEGSYCMLGFDGGDPEEPYAGLWDSESAVTKVTFEGAESNISRIGDQVDIYMPDVLPVTGTVDGLAFVGTFNFALAAPGVGIIATGNPKFDA